MTAVQNPPNLIEATTFQRRSAGDRKEERDVQNHREHIDDRLAENNRVIHQQR